MADVAELATQFAKAERRYRKATVQFVTIQKAVKTGWASVEDLNRAQQEMGVARREFHTIRIAKLTAEREQAKNKMAKGKVPPRLAFARWLVQTGRLTD